MVIKKDNTLEKHTAVPQMAGYLYQVQCALIRLFDLEEGECLGIEIADDVHVEKNDIITELGQYKYHSPKKKVKLKDTSPEFWKTLGIWAGAISDKSFDLLTIRNFILFTRAIPSPGSTVEILAKSGNRNVDEVITNLLAVPRPSGLSSKKLAESFDTVHALPKDEMRLLFQKILIQAEQSNLQETLDTLKRRIRNKVFHEKSVETASKYLCGWLWETVLKGLESPKGVQIFEADFHSAICTIRDELAGNRLQARYADMEIDDLKVELVKQEECIYIKQLDIVGASLSTKSRSVLDYFRAMRERSDWIASGELLPQQLIAFDRELFDRWKPEFDAMCEDLDDDDRDEELQRTGLLHFRSIQKFEVPIQIGWIHSYLTKGSYHALADKLHVGWHPRFQKIITISNL